LRSTRGQENHDTGVPPRVRQTPRRCNAIREKRQPAVPGSDARNAVATICATYEAAKTGRTVQVK